MKRCLFVAAGLVLSLLLLANSGQTEPVKGSQNAKLRLPAGNPGIQPLPPQLFRGGQRACVILTGDHDPIVDVGIEVYDENNRLIVKDDTSTRQRVDYSAVIWYPPADGLYTIKLLNFSAQYNDCYLVLK